MDFQWSWRRVGQISDYYILGSLTIQSSYGVDFGAFHFQDKPVPKEDSS